MSNLARIENTSPSFLESGGFLTPAQVASELGISRRTLARWEVLRIGPPRVEIARKILYRRASVLAWLEERESARGRNRRRR